MRLYDAVRRTRLRVRTTLERLTGPRSEGGDVSVTLTDGTDATRCNRALHLVWGAGRPNFGDALSPIIIQVLSGRPLVGRDGENELFRFSERRLLALCSSMHKAVDGDVIWGTGSKGTVFASSLEIAAVRGPLTRKLLQNRGMECPAVFGDPGLLMPYLYTPTDRISAEVGYVPHFDDRSHIELDFPERVEVITVDRPPLEVIDRIAACDVVISSSLHGVILAEAYGIPACWATPAEELWVGGQPQVEFKYHDYYLSTGREPIKYEFTGELDPAAAASIARAADPPVVDVEDLLLSFPYLRPGISTLGDLDRFQIATVDR